MGDALRGRRCRLTLSVPVKTAGDFSGVETTNETEIGGTDDPANPGLRIQFKISKTREKEPNKGEITVTNLAPRSRAALQTKGVKAVLEVGYSSTGLTRIFVMDVRTIDHVREKSDWQTVLKGGDGERAFRYAQASESFAADTKAGDILKYLGKQLGLDKGNIDTEAKRLTVKFGQGYVVCGSAQSALDRLLGSLGYDYSIQDGALQILETGEAITGTAIPLISPESGLIGSPEAGTPEKKGGAVLITFTSLIDKSLKPGSKVHLKCARYDDDLALKRVEYEGDTRGQSWYCHMQGVKS